VNPFATLLLRDIKLAARSGGQRRPGPVLFALVATLVPLGVGADLGLLVRVAGGVLWVGAVLSALLSLDRLFQGDFRGRQPGPDCAGAPAAGTDRAGQDRRPLAFHRPAADRAVAVAGACCSTCLARQPRSCLCRC